jgi:hypothetical protein
MQVLLPENILRWMTADDRRKYAKGQRTAEETIARAVLGQEKELHENYMAFLNRNEFDYCHSAWGKRATIQPGLPDFHVWRGLRHCFVEFKSAHGRLSDEQIRVIEKMKREGTPILVTQDYMEAVHFTARELAPQSFLLVAEGRLGAQAIARGHGSRTTEKASLLADLK